MKRSVLALSVLAGLASVASAQFYGGDPDLVNGLWAVDTSYYGLDGRVYEDFNWGGGNVTSVYGNYFLTSGNVDGYRLYIRSGVSSGNGGTLVYSETGAAYTAGLNGFDAFGFNGYRVDVDNADFFLPAGTYHIALTLVDDDGDYGYVQTTSGANSIGGPIGNGNSFFDSSAFGAFFLPTSSQYGVDLDHSYGVNIPAPSALALLGLGGLAAARRRR